MNNQVNVKELYNKIINNEKMVIIDLRSPEKFKTWKIDTMPNQEIHNLYYAEMLDTGDIEKDMENYIKTKFEKKFSQDAPIYTVCSEGETSKIFSKVLSSLGYKNVNNIKGGMKNWFNYYDYRTVIETPELSIYQISRVSRGDLSWVIISDNQATIIDPLRHIDNYLKFIESKNAKLAFILDTHVHADHISGGPEISEKLNIPYYFHPYDAIHPIDMIPGKVKFSFLKEGDILTLGSAKIKVIHVPGHTLGNLVFLVNDKYLFTGDTIFIDSIARPDLGGKGETWAPLQAESLLRLSQLPNETILLPAHFSKFSEANKDGLYIEKLEVIKEKNKDYNYLLTNGKEKFIKYMLDNLPVFPPQYVDIKRVNVRLIEVDQQKAEELETGKNVCALAKAYA